MSRLSIRAKMVAIIALLLVAMTGLGLLAIRTMHAINAHTEQMASNWLPSVRTLGELRSAINLHRAQLRAFMMADNAEEKATLEKAMASTITFMDEKRSAYRRLLSTAGETALFEDWSRTWDEYVKSTAGVVDVSRKSGSLREANELFAKTVRPIANKSDEYLKRAIELNERGAEAETRNAAEGYAFAFRFVAGIIGLAILGGIGLGTLFVKDISSCIGSIVAPMHALGQGDLTVEIPHQGEKTEIGTMASALRIFKDALIDKKAADEAAARDAELKIERGRRLEQLTSTFETVATEIVETVSRASIELEGHASALSNTAVRSRERATTVAAASEEASTNVQSVASATEELSSSVNEISRQVQDSARMASEAVGQANKTNEKVGELSRAAARIGDVVELINNIAGQTNLLALNATIEAARAGEAGRGFAVVASEVKALAEQTAKATGEIGQQISGIQAATEESVGAIQEIGSTIGRLAEISSAIAAAVEEQGAATQEISRNVQQAAHGTQQVSSNVTDVQRGASDTGTASEQVLSAAQSLSHDSGRLRLEVRKFIDSVRAA